MLDFFIALIEFNQGCAKIHLSMKNSYAIIVSLLFFLQANIAQVVFCPPGAEWHYNYKIWDLQPNVYFTSIKYVGDSIINQDTLKILKHRYFDMTASGGLMSNTLIKQKGDTVFMNNYRTKFNWEILYNFATLPGQTWDANYSVYGGTMRFYSFYVDSINYEMVNGFNLKNLFVKVFSTVNAQWYQYNTFKISERFGCTNFMFMFGDEGMSDANWISAFLCYQDNTFGLKQFTNNACDYKNVGIQQFSNAEKNITVYPNPLVDLLSIDIDSEQFLNDNKVELIISDMLGSTIKKVYISQHTQIDLSDLESAVYILKFGDKSGFISSHKLIKN